MRGLTMSSSNAFVSILSCSDTFCIFSSVLRASDFVSVAMAGSVLQLADLLVKVKQLARILVKVELDHILAVDAGFVVFAGSGWLP